MELVEIMSFKSNNLIEINLRLVFHQTKRVGKIYDRIWIFEDFFWGMCQVLLSIMNAPDFKFLSNQRSSI